MEVYQKYRDWVRRNGNVLALAETGLSTLTWLLPDRFTDNELSLEAVHTGINLISAMHDTMLNDLGPGAPPGAAELTFALSALQQVQVLVELWGLYSERNGSIDSHYDPLIAVEGLKSIVRLAILRTSGCRILANGGATTFDPVLQCGSGGPFGRGTSRAPTGSEAHAKEVFTAFAAFRDKHCFVPTSQEEDIQHDDDAKKREQENGKEQQQQQQRYWWDEKTIGSGEDMYTTAAHQNDPLQHSERPAVSTYDAPRVLQPSPAVSSAQALRDLERRTAVRQAAAARPIIAGELVHILRPLLYVAALRRYGRRSWKPWLLSVVLELASARLAAAGATASQRAAAEASRDPAVAGTALAALYGMQGVRWKREELDELTRRKLLLLYALLRDPFFGRVTGPAVERWKQRLGRVPLVGRVADKAAEVLIGVQKYYTYTAGS